MAGKNHEVFVPVNKRNNAQWAVIQPHVDFKGKSVVDLGCGAGDMLLRAKSAGAAQVIGVDKNHVVLDQTRTRCRHTGIQIVLADLLDWLTRHDETFDIAICFSVLPYVSPMIKVLELIWGKSKQALIECQYLNDGPGVVRGDYDMRRILNTFWPVVEKIGFTVVEGRNTERSIWLCSKGERHDG